MNGSCNKNAAKMLMSKITLVLICRILKVNIHVCLGNVLRFLTNVKHNPSLSDSELSLQEYGIMHIQVDFYVWLTQDSLSSLGTQYQSVDEMDF